MTRPKQPKRPCEIRREQGRPGPFFPPGALDWDGDWSTPPPPCEVTAIGPMKLPSFKIFEMNSLLDEEATEDIVCRVCKKVIIPKGDMMSSVNKTTHYLSMLNEISGKPIWTGKNEYSCHDCLPPKPFKYRGRLGRRPRDK